MKNGETIKRTKEHLIKELERLGRCLKEIEGEIEEIEKLLSEIEEAPNPEKLKCKDCIFLDLEKKCSIGCYCTAPKNWPHSVSAWKSPTAPACKTYFKRREPS